MDNLERLIAEQVHAWAMREAKAKKAEKSAEVWPVITISREYGAGGRSLANELARRIGFKVWDKELLSAIADEAGADERFLASLDERRRKMIEDTFYGSFMGAKISNTHYFRSLLSVVQTIGAHGKGIIVGRGGNYIIKSPSALRVRLVAPLDHRVTYVANLEGISEPSAEKMIKTRDAERDDFIQHYFKRDSQQSYDYDLVLNAGVFKIPEMADLVLLAYEKKVGKAAPIVS